VAVEGELDLATRPRLSAALDRHLSAGRRFAQLDLVSLTFCDAAGLGSLVQARSSFVAARGGFSLIGCRPRLMRLLEITELTEFLDATAIGGSRSDAPATMIGRRPRSEPLTRCAVRGPASA
jgi:anti-anti-sigma factor